MKPLHPGSQGERWGHGVIVAKELGEIAHLLFEWPIRQAPRLALPGCILVAAVMQAVTIILFSISYKTPSEAIPSSPQIYFLPADSAAARQIAPWLEANDPAVFSPQYAARDALPAPPPLKYRPSYEEPPPPLRPLPVEIVRPVEPPSIPLNARILRSHAPRLKTAASPPHSSSVPAPEPPPSIVRWQDELATRTPLPPSSAPVPLTETAQPTLYEVGVSEEGVPMHCDLLDSSGDPLSDEAGSVWIHTQRFQPAAHASWGRVLILWGTPPPRGMPGATPQSNPRAEAARAQSPPPQPTP